LRHLEPRQHRAFPVAASRLGHHASVVEHTRPPLVRRVCSQESRSRRRLRPRPRYVLNGRVRREMRLRPRPWPRGCQRSADRTGGIQAESHESENDQQNSRCDRLNNSSVHERILIPIEAPCDGIDGGQIPRPDRHTTR